MESQGLTRRVFYSLTCLYHSRIPELFNPDLSTSFHSSSLYVSLHLLSILNLLFLRANYYWNGHIGRYSALVVYFNDSPWLTSASRSHLPNLGRMGGKHQIIHRPSQFPPYRYRSGPCIRPHEPRPR